MEKIHIGKKIHSVLAQSPLTMVAFTKMIGVDRQTGDSIFKRKSIKIDQLKRSESH